MSYRWKPSKRQKEEYKQRLKEKEILCVHTTPHAIREGCFVKWYSMAHGRILQGPVIKSSYGAKTGQHTFTISTILGLTLVKGRNLYPNIITHIQGDESKNTS